MAFRSGRVGAALSILCVAFLTACPSPDDPLGRGFNFR
jgi:hypothetical protein